MAKVRKIERAPPVGRNYYLADANFLINRCLPLSAIAPGPDRDRVKACQDWWAEINAQLVRRHARVYIPDVCIAESFKALASLRFSAKKLSAAEFAKARKQLSSFVRIETKTLRGFSRNIRVHDISTHRDIIISVERFFELFAKHKKNVQIADLILVATAKYLMDFYDVPKDLLHIVTMDNALREGISKAVELPNAYDPTRPGHRAAVVFI
jgi:predicted nucleic acid-binding protein